MSVTREEPGSAGMVRAADAGLAQKSPSAAQRLAPLRELIDDRLLDALLERSRDEAGGLRLTGEGSMLGELVKAVLERALEAELTARLGYARNDRAGRGGGHGNYRNGTIAKTVQTGVGPVPLAVPRDRAGTSGSAAGAQAGRAGRRRPGRHDHLALRARHVRAGHPASPGAGLRHPAVPRDRLEDYRRRAGGGPGLAVPAAGPRLCRSVPSRDPGGVRDNHVVQNKPAYTAVGTGADGEKHVPASTRRRGPQRPA